jgi:hypothetical protein
MIDPGVQMRRVHVGLAGMAMLIAVAVPAVASGPPTLTGGDHVTICHATGSVTHPYVRISPSVAGVVHGHLTHQDHRDVVPEFVYRGRRYSQNWTADGQTFLAGGCVGAFTPGGGPTDGSGGPL